MSWVWISAWKRTSIFTCLLIYTISHCRSLLRSLLEFGTKDERRFRNPTPPHPPVCSPAEAPSDGVGFITRAGKSRAEQNKAEDFIRGLAILSFINLTPWDSRGVFSSSGQSEWIMKMSAGSVPLILTYFMIMKGDQRMIMIGKAAADAAGCSAGGSGEEEEEEGATSGRMAGVSQERGWRGA